MVIRFTKVVPAAAVGAAAFTVFSAGAIAFFPPVPVGTNEVKTVPPVPVTPVVPVVPMTPPTTPKHTCQSPPVVPPTVPVTPNAVPEPATMLTGLMGLSMVGMAAVRRRMKTQHNEEPKAE
jgi:hypothetical protein